MPPAKDSPRYDAVSQTLHWITAGLVIALLLTGKVGEIEPDEPESAMFVWHSSLGLLVLLFAVARIIWGFIGHAPAPPAGMTRLGRVLARSMHVSLYVLLLALPLSGWLAASAEGASANFFWVASLPRWDVRTPRPGATPPFASATQEDQEEDQEGVARRPPEGKKEKNEVLEEAHEMLGDVLLILASLHTLAALKHQFIDRDELLRRMLPRWARHVAPQSGPGS